MNRKYIRPLLNWQILVALVILGVFIATAIAAPLLSSPPEGENVDNMYKVIGRQFDRTSHPPSPENPLGTLPGQLDIFHSLVWGTRHALRFGLVVALSTALIGVVVGSIAGYSNNFLSQSLLRITDGFLAIPMIIGVGIFKQLVFLAEPGMGSPAIQQIMGFLGKDFVILGLIFFSWMPYARIIAANFTKVRQLDYVTAAHTIGASRVRIVLRHLLPNAITPAIVLIARDIGAMVVWGAAFVFIGIGGDSPWGLLATLGRDYVVGSFGNPFQMWWTYVPVTLALVLFGIGWNLLGDGLNDALNPYENHW